MNKRIERLEFVVGTLINWLYGFGLNEDQVKNLLKMLEEKR